jgi:DNA mismatch repair ATPase MutS
MLRQYTQAKVAHWLEQPLLQLEAINARLETVTELAGDALTAITVLSPAA